MEATVTNIGPPNVKDTTSAKGNSLNPINNAMIAAASSEGDAAKNWSTNYNNVAGIVDKIFGVED